MATPAGPGLGAAMVAGSAGVVRVVRRGSLFRIAVARRRLVATVPPFHRASSGVWSASQSSPVRCRAAARGETTHGARSLLQGELDPLDLVVGVLDAGVVAVEKDLDVGGKAG